MPKYHINVFYSQDDEGFIADIPDLQYCSAFGNTPEEAVAEVMIAQKLWLETAEARGMEIPQPRYQAPTSQVS